MHEYALVVSCSAVMVLSAAAPIEAPPPRLFTLLARLIRRLLHSLIGVEFCATSPARRKSVQHIYCKAIRLSWHSLVACREFSINYIVAARLKTAGCNQKQPSLGYRWCFGRQVYCGWEFYAGNCFDMHGNSTNRRLGVRLLVASGCRMKAAERRRRYELNASSSHRSATLSQFQKTIRIPVYQVTCHHLQTETYPSE